MGNVDPVLLGNLLLGSIPGVVFGTMIGSKVPEGVLRGAISVVLVLVGIKLILS
jgi:uncharacterized membrane protein YfcA